MSDRKTVAWPARVAVALLAAGSSVACAASHGAAATTVSGSGWTTVWRDDFGGAGKLSPDWVYRAGTQVAGGPAQFGTGEIEVNTDSTANVYQRDGRLHVRAIRDAAGGWTSGRVETARADFRPPTHGVLAVEARLQLPGLVGDEALGYWSAFWMLGAPYRQNSSTWPAVGEIDVMENAQGANTVWTTMHCGTSPGGPCRETTGLDAQTAGRGPSLQSTPHTYRVEWDQSSSPAQLRWYLDGRLIHQISQSQLPARVWSTALAHGFYLILDLAVGGAFPAAFGGGPTEQTGSGGELVADYVAVESRG